jgi:hypothetical protein
MVDSPHVWDIGEDIIIDLAVADPITGNGLTGQAGFITLTIEKRSLGRFWNGALYVASPFSLSMTEVDSTNSPGLYRYVLDGTTGNVEVDQYFAHANVSNFPTVEGDDYSIHAVRDAQVKVYESEPRVIA